jgi:hypothetical protein
MFYLIVALNSAQHFREWHIATLADGTVACWHPEKAFPYEDSRPIDLEVLAKDRKVFIAEIFGYKAPAVIRGIIELSCLKIGAKT